MTRYLLGFLLLPSLFTTQTLELAGQEDPVVQRIIQLGTTDNQAMVWADIATNRFGGRLTGSDAYINAADWALWQFREWGLDAYLDPVGELPVGFNRGPWFGTMVVPEEKSLYFGTPSFTAGTKGVQRGPVAILNADPFSVPGRNPSPEQVEAKRLAVEEAIQEVQADPSRFDGAWILIGGESSGFARDGRRPTPEYSDSFLMPPLTQALLDAGALGTIQRATLPLRILDGYASSWDELPRLPDIKLLDTQYDEIRERVEAAEPVELEFQIRNWFKMGPVPFHNVVGVIPGTTYPNEFVILGGHFDSFDGGTGGVDDGSGFSPGMEALRLIKEAGGAPKRSIAMILFAAEEIGLVGSQDWLADRPEVRDDVVVMINRDGSPSAVTGAVVPPQWAEAMEAITEPLEDLNPQWPFELAVDPYPSLKPESPGGSDHSSFSMLGIPLLRFRTETDYSYGRAWHTLYDTYSELVPYRDHQEHSALVTAVVAYGIANLDEPLPREGVYLPDGLYADMVTESGARVMVSLDYQHVPAQVARFIQWVEGSGTQGPEGMGQRFSGPVGSIESVEDRLIAGILGGEEGLPEALQAVPLDPNPVLTHAEPGIFGLSDPAGFYLTRVGMTESQAPGSAVGRIVAGDHVLGEIAPGEAIRRIRILPSGQEAQAFVERVEIPGGFLDTPGGGPKIPRD